MSSVTLQDAVPSGAYNRVLTFDSSLCHGNAQGMVYFAVGSRVFRQPENNLSYITGGPAQAGRKLTTPPVQEPEGCPSNPITAQVYDLGKLSALRESRGDVAKHADHVTVTVGDEPSAYTEDPMFAELQKARGLQTSDVIGFMQTRKPPEIAYYVAFRSLNYLTPDGKKLTVNCYGEAQGLVHCHYGYMLHPGMSVSFSFRTEDVPMSELLETDQEIRRRFAAAEVPIGTETRVNSQ